MGNDTNQGRRARGGRSARYAVGTLLALSGETEPALADTAATNEDVETLVSGDNPGFTNVTSPAPRYSLVTEQLATVAWPQDAVQLALPNLLARVGVLDWLELRAILPSAVVSTQLDVDQLSVGAVFAAAFNERLSGSLVPMLVMPIVADDGVGALGVEGNLQANLSYTATERWSIAGAVRGGWIQQRPDPEDALQAHITLRAGLLGQYTPMPELALFVQSYVDYVQGDTVEPSVGGGFSYWIVSSVSLFAEANSGLIDGSPPVQIALGAVVRWW